MKRRNLRAQVAQRDGGVCVDCPPEVGPWQYWEADHIIPLARGGADELDNIATRCASHHRAKTAVDGCGGRPNRDMVMTSFYLGRADKAAVGELAAERNEPQADTVRAMLAYAAQRMPRDWTPPKGKP